MANNQQIFPPCQSPSSTVINNTQPFITVSPIGLVNGASTKNNGANYGPDTPGTVTSGIQEAITAANQAINIYLLEGTFNCTGQIVIPNTSGSTTVKIVGSGMFDTIVQYNGTVAQDFVITTAASNPAGPFNTSFSIQDVTFQYVPNNQNYIMSLTQVQGSVFNNVQFFGTNGAAFPPAAPQGIIGLKISPHNANANEFINCWWQNLAVGIEGQADHMKFFGCYWAGCGIYNSGAGNTAGTSYVGNLYAVGMAVFLNPLPAIHELFDCEFYNCHWFLNNVSILDGTNSTAQGYIPMMVGGFSESSNYDVLSLNNTTFVMWDVQRNGSNVSGSVNSSGVISPGFTGLFRAELWQGQLNILSGPAQNSIVIPDGQFLQLGGVTVDCNLHADGSGNTFLNANSGGSVLIKTVPSNNDSALFVGPSGITIKNSSGGTAIATSSSTGAFTNGFNLPLVGTGVPMQVTDGASIGASTNQTIINYVPPSAIGLYRLNATIETTAGTNTGTIAFQLTYSNFNGTAITLTIPLIATNGSIVTSGTGSSTVFLGIPPLFVIDASATHIVCSTVVTGTVAYNAYALLEEMT